MRIGGKKRWLIVFAVVLLINGNAFGQVLDGIFVPEHTNNRQVIQWTHLREADVMWHKRIWRVLDLREKQNQIFYYPTVPANNRKSLIDVIFDGIKNDGTLTAYDALFGEDFSLTLSLQEVLEKISGVTETAWVPSPDPPYDLESKITTTEFNNSSIKLYRLKEEWFFDKQRSVMEARIIGICPVEEELDEEGLVKGPKPLFWLYFKEARYVFINHETYNRYNDVERRTYDDVFWKRQFASYIYKESNVFNRKIQNYAAGLDALLEADRIKYEMITKEIDYWSY
ncbi:MAG: gliding motility protein GldN [Bacteroidetes bacterium]|nr:gliding motility protein GldN [Bacteroidota bacterium]